ncbi:MAG: HAMP domain-containing protein [Ferrovum sp.]|nr:HAMP domain-containing protein [Ferrovum sp.]NDU86737.1 HAMP domain-containing protein [Ferrovum sp.]
MARHDSLTPPLTAPAPALQETAPVAPAWLRSLRVRLGVSVGMLLLLLLMSVLSAWNMTRHTAGESSVLNETAAMRMLLWRLVVERSEQPRDSFEKTLGDMQHRIDHLSDLKQNHLIPATSTLPLHIQSTWRERIRPQLISPSKAGDELWLQRSIPPFTHEIDQIVGALEQDLESSIQTLRWVQGAVFFLAIILTLSILQRLQQEFFSPLDTLHKAALAVKNGRFSIRIANNPANELGDLGEAFNTMVERLSRLYSGLENLVEEKTRELQQSNHSLQLLYRTASRLADSELNQEVLLALLVDVEQALGLGPGILCVRREEDSRAYPLATPLPEAERAALCDSLGCNICFGSGAPQGITEHQVGNIHLVSIPLMEGGTWQGVMPFQLKAGTPLAAWQTPVLETLARHVATALANARRAEERHRLAVYEERAVIARELHDSLAQSLSYLKIQVSLLQTRVKPSGDDAVQATVDELKTGLNSAYRELRELLTTFRLTPGHTHFTEELEAIVQEASRRCGFDIVLKQHMNNLELNANEEVHLSRLIRESLINIERHAAATWAQVTLTANNLRQVELMVEDNGKGLTEPSADRPHFGLTIMRERATFLKGQIHFSPRAEGGTRITLTFIAQTPYSPPPLH